MGINCFPMAFIEGREGPKLPYEICARLCVAGTEDAVLETVVILNKNVRPGPC